MHISEVLSTLPLDRASATALSRQLYLAVKDAILHGTLTPGLQLPPTRELCRLLAVSRQTVLHAWSQLSAEGYLCATVGRGTFVSAHLPVTPTPAQASPCLMRPLSARGQAYAGAMAASGVHQDANRAFRPSMPGIDLFPFDVWSRLEARRWRGVVQRRGHHLGYCDPAGFAPLRELLAVYLRASRAVNCSPEQIIITAGSQQALYLLAAVLLERGDAVWAESPGYPGASAPLRALGARVCTVPVTAEGMDVAYGAAHYPDARMVLSTPSHQLPLGVTMNLQRRLELLHWAAQQRAWIVEDDYDSEFRYDGPPLASLQGLDRAGCVVYVGTFSKVLFPSLRLGYIVAPPALVEPLARAKAMMDRHSALPPQMVLADFMEGGHFARHIRRARDAYRERRDALVRGIERLLPDQLECGPVDSGLDLCVRLRRRADEAAVVQAAGRAGIDLRGLDYYALPGAAPACAVGPGLLLGFAAVTPAQIAVGLEGLAGVLRRDVYCPP